MTKAALQQLARHFGLSENDGVITLRNRLKTHIWQHPELAENEVYTRLYGCRRPPPQAPANQQPDKEENQSEQEDQQRGDENEHQRHISPSNASTDNFNEEPWQGIHRQTVPPPSQTTHTSTRHSTPDSTQSQYLNHGQSF